MARHFVQYSECLSNLLPFYTTQIIKPFLYSCSQPIVKKALNVPLSSSLVFFVLQSCNKKSFNSVS